MGRYVIQPTAAELRANARPRFDDEATQLLAEEIDALDARIDLAQKEIVWLTRRRAGKRAELIERRRRP